MTDRINGKDLEWIEAEFRSLTRAGATTYAKLQAIDFARIWLNGLAGEVRRLRRENEVAKRCLVQIQNAAIELNAKVNPTHAPEFKVGDWYVVDGELRKFKEGEVTILSPSSVPRHATPDSE